MASARWGILLICLVCSSLGAAAEYKCDGEVAQMEVKRLTSAGVFLSVSQFPPNVSVTVDERHWAKTAAEERKRWAQEVECATSENYANMLRTVTFRGRDTSLLGAYSGSDLKR
jgi:hypothetical protein